MARSFRYNFLNQRFYCDIHNANVTASGSSERCACYKASCCVGRAAVRKRGAAGGLAGGRRRRAMTRDAPPQLTPRRPRDASLATRRYRRLCENPPDNATGRPLVHTLVSLVFALVMMVSRSGRYTVNWRGFRDFAFGNKPPDEG